MCMLLYVAPVAFGQVSVGVRGGMNASNIEFDGESATLSEKAIWIPYTVGMPTCC